MRSRPRVAAARTSYPSVPDFLMPTAGVIQRDEELVRYIYLKLAALGHRVGRSAGDLEFLEIIQPLLRNYHQKDQLLGGRLCPADGRIQAFLDSYLSDIWP